MTNRKKPTIAFTSPNFQSYPSVREAILAALRVRGWTKYELWRALGRWGHDTSRSTVYGYLRDEGWTDAGSDVASAMMGVLGVEIVYRHEDDCACPECLPGRNNPKAG